MKKWIQKLGKRGKAGLLAGTAAVVVAVVAVFFLIFSRKEEAYRNIRVSEVRGVAKVNREGMEGLELFENMNLFSGDEIVTERGAQLTLRLDEDKYILVDEDSKLTLHATGTAADSKTTLQLEYGAVFSDIKNKLSEKSSYEVVTPASTMSVRGTQVEVVCARLYDESGKESGTSVKILTYEGTVSIAPAGSDEVRSLPAGKWEEITRTAEGNSRFEGEAKEITAEDFRDFSAQYLKESLTNSEKPMTEEQKQIALHLEGLVKEHLGETEPTPDAEPSKEPTPSPEPTPSAVPSLEPSPEPTPSAVPSLEPSKEPTPSPSPMPTPSPIPTLSPSPTPSQMPTPSPTPSVTQYTVNYYLPLIPDQLTSSYFLNCENGPAAITLDAGGKTGSSLNSFVTDGRQKNTQIFADNQDITEDLKNAAKWHVEGAGELQERLQGAVVKCHGWYDQYGNFWSLTPDSEQKIADKSNLKGTTLNLYAVYSVEVPADADTTDFAGQTVECKVLHLTVDEYDGEGNLLESKRYSLSLPSGCQIEYGQAEHYKLFWETEYGVPLDGKTITINPGRNAYSLHIEKIWN